MNRALVESHVVVALAEVHEVSRAYGDYSSQGHRPQQTPRDIEYHGEAHGGYCRGNGIAQIGVVGRHAQVFHEVVHPAHGDCHGDSERHCRNHKQGVYRPVESHLHMTVYHIRYEVYQRNARHDEQCTCHEGMPRGIGMEQ